MADQHPRATPRHVDLHADPELVEHARKLNLRWLRDDLAAKPVDPVQQAVDDYILMERKARAWDLWVENVGPSNPYVLWEGRPLREYLDALLAATRS